MNKKQEDVKVDFEQFKDFSENEKLVKEWKFIDEEDEDSKSKNEVKTTNTISLTNERVVISTREDFKHGHSYKKHSYKLDDITSTTCSTKQTYKAPKLWSALVGIGALVFIFTLIISTTTSYDGVNVAPLVIGIIIALGCIGGGIAIFFKGKKQYYTDIRIGVLLKSSNKLDITDILMLVDDQRVMLKSKKHFDDIIVESVKTASEFAQEFDNLVIEEQMKRNKAK